MASQLTSETPMHSLLDFADLQALAIAQLADIDDDQYLLINLEGPCPTGTELTKAGRWLTRQPKVVVGFSTDQNNGLSVFVDVIASNPAELNRILSQISANPVSATVLVQVLRTTKNMPVQDALTIESLAFSTLQSGTEFASWLQQYRKEHPEQTRGNPLDESPAVLLSRDHDDLKIVLNRPDNQNAFSAEMRDALFEAFQLVALDKTISRAQVSALGPCFCTGGDLKEFGHYNNAAEAHLIRTIRLPSRLIADAPEKFEFHLHRACVGSGIEIPAFANSVSATSKTYFQLPEISMGLIPGAGGCISIPRRIGSQRTAYLALSGKRINASTALEWGLIDSIVD